VQQSRCGFRKMRLYFRAVIQHKTTERSQKIKPLFQRKSRDPYQASLYACNKAAAAFEKHGFVSARHSFNKKAAIRARLVARVQQSRSGFRKTRVYFSTAFQHKTTERSQKIKPLFQQKCRNLCTRATKLQRLSKNTALFLSTLQHGLSTQNNREVTKNKAALSTKKPQSVPGFIVRVQQSRSGFRKTRVYFSTAFQHITTGRSQKIKLAVAQAARRCQSRSPLLKPLSVVKAARRCQGRPPLLKLLAAAKATRRC
jgi:hypothetical protein